MNKQKYLLDDGSQITYPDFVELSKGSLAAAYRIDRYGRLEEVLVSWTNVEDLRVDLKRLGTALPNFFHKGVNLELCGKMSSRLCSNLTVSCDSVAVELPAVRGTNKSPQPSRVLVLVRRMKGYSRIIVL